MKLFRLPPILAFLEAAEMWNIILLVQVETGQWVGMWTDHHSSRPRCNAKSTGLWGLVHNVQILPLQPRDCEPGEVTSSLNLSFLIYKMQVITPTAVVANYHKLGALK